MTREEIIKRREQGARLRKARESAGYRSARSAALENNWAESTYRAHEGGTRTIGQNDAEAYAKRLRHKGATITAAHILFGDGSPPSANATPPEPPTLPLGLGGEAIKDTQLTDIPRTRAQLEILESQIVREAAAVAIRKVYWLLSGRRPTDDEERVLVGFAIEDYEAQKGQKVELAKVAAQTRLEAEDRRVDKASERESSLR